MMAAGMKFVLETSWCSEISSSFRSDLTMSCLALTLCLSGLLSSGLLLIYGECMSSDLTDDSSGEFR